MEELELTPPTCRLCGKALQEVVIDLGASPLANSYLEPRQLVGPEPFYPLCVYVCTDDWLVQLPAAVSGEEIFSDYAYFSSFSASWVEHARQFVDDVSERFALGPESQVVEVASNDGYLLQHFVERGVPVLGVEPAANVAEAAREKGIKTEVRFFGRDFGRELRERGVAADLIVGNNVMAHVPDLTDFVGGLPHVLAEQGVVSIEVPHLLRLLQEGQFDTIYHEHYSYFSVRSARRVFSSAGLRLFDVEPLSTHGGSLRLFAAHDGSAHEETERLRDALAEEEAFGLETIEPYRAFSELVHRVRRDLLRFLIDCQADGKTVVGYGAPAKGNTLLNYCGVKPDLLPYTVDLSPHKQGLFLPGTRIPIFAPEKIFETRPDYVLILPWNLRDEISKQMADIEEWAGRFVVPIPSVEVFAAPRAADAPT